MKTTKNSITNYKAKFNLKISIFISILIYCVFLSNLKNMAQVFITTEPDNIMISDITKNVPSNLFQSFEVLAVDGIVYLKWCVKDKDNNKNYLVKRSQDGITYETIGYLKGIGRTNGFELMNCYSDKKPISGYSYYRIATNSEEAGLEISKSILIYVTPPDVNPHNKNVDILVDSKSNKK